MTISYLYLNQAILKLNHTGLYISIHKHPPEVFCKKGALKNFAKFTGKHLCQSLFFDKVHGPKPATLLKKRLWLRCFPVNFAKFSRTPLLQNTSGRLLLNIYTPLINYLPKILWLFHFYLYLKIKISHINTNNLLNTLF